MHFSRVLDDITPLSEAGLVIWWFLEHVRWRWTDDAAFSQASSRRIICKE